jgi:arsenite/tail-anchored protein-transporting ATPase
MSAALLNALSARVIFVVGKGGVGKSTAAAAIALGLADLEHTTHIISVDPAHSTSDLLEQPSSSAPVVSECNANLVIDEFNADQFSRSWLDELRPALIEVSERGTYLDAADARSFLDLSLPGVDEIMAALRILELIDQPIDRIVIDTAPTGHLLRLLQAAGLLDSWSDALEAIIAKADAVAIGMVGVAPEWGAGPLLQRWRAQSSAFTTVLQGAQFVVVTRGDVVVEAETKRLLEELRRRSFSVAVVLANTQSSALADRFVPQQEPAPIGCNGLRHWLSAVRPATTKTAAQGSTPAEQSVKRQLSSKAFSVREILTQPLILVAGKGGVGKSTVASAIAIEKATGASTCLVSTDPAGSLADVLAIAVNSEPTLVLPGLQAWQLAADQELQRLQSQYAEDVGRVFEKLGLDQAVRLDRAVIDRLWNLAPPGLDEIVALTELMSAAERCPEVVLDSAPTAHFLRLIQLPELTIEWSHALMRLLLKYGVAGALEDFTTEILGFARRTRELQARLIATDQACAVLVALDEPVVWAETARLHAALDRAKIPVAALVVNRTDAGPFHGHPPVGSTARVIRAPNLETSPIGADALRDFVRRWEVLT